MLNFVKKHWLIIFLAALAALLGFFWFLIKSRPQVTPPPTQAGVLERPDLPGEQINPNTQITITASPMPDQVGHLLSVLKAPPFTENEIRAFANQLGFTGEPFITEDVSSGKTHNWSFQDEFLIITPNKNKIIFGQDLLFSPPPQTGILPSPEIASSQLLAFARSLGLSSLDLGTKTEAGYLSLAEPEAVPTDKQSADALEVSLVTQFAGKSLITGIEELVVMFGWFDKNGNLVRFDWENPIKSVSPKEEYPLKSVSEIREVVLQRGQVLVFDNDLPVARAGGNLAAATINQIEIVYPVPTAGSLSHPVYLLRGQGRLSDGRNVEVEIFLPAVKEEFFRN